MRFIAIARFIMLVSLLILVCVALVLAQENQIQDFSSFFNAESSADTSIKPIIYKKFHILIFHNDNGFRFEAHRILKINGQNIRSDKAIKYFGQGFQQYAWDNTENDIGIRDYYLLAGNTHRGWSQWSTATTGQTLPWMTFRRGQIVYVSYERGREWAWAQHWNTKKGASDAAKRFINYVTGIR